MNPEMSDASAAWPLVAAIVTFVGVLITVLFQWRAFAKQQETTQILRNVEVRERWINDLRLTMSNFQSYGVTPDLAHDKAREFYQYGTHIELLMDRTDPNYGKLSEALYAFLSAESRTQKYAANSDYIKICQDILKNEIEKLDEELARISKLKRRGKPVGRQVAPARDYHIEGA